MAEENKVKKLERITTLEELCDVLKDEVGGRVSFPSEQFNPKNWLYKSFTDSSCIVTTTKNGKVVSQRAHSFEPVIKAVLGEMTASVFSRLSPELKEDLKWHHEKLSREKELDIQDTRIELDENIARHRRGTMLMAYFIVAASIIAAPLLHGYMNDNDGIPDSEPPATFLVPDAG